LVEKKGFIYGIRVICDLIERGYTVNYTIVGEGPLRSELEAEVEALGLSKYINLVGAKSHEELRSIYKNADVLLVPSVTARNGDKEGQVVVVQEAGLVGIPVIASLHDGIPDGIVDNVTGFLVAEKNIDGISRRLQFFCDNRDMIREMGLAHREFVLNKYTKNVIATKIVSLF
jgi:colanic acid/amylovoran biosynthesis glycosyltransferase